MAICISQNHIYKSCFNGDVEKIRIVDGVLIQRISVESMPYSMCVSPDERFLYVTYSCLNMVVQGSPVRKYQLSDGSLMPMNGCIGNLICLSGDGELLFISRDFSNEIQVVSADDGSNIRTIQYNQDIRGLSCISQGGEFLFASDYYNRQIYVFNLNGNGDVRIIQTSSLISRISYDGEFLFASNGSNIIQVLRVDDGSVVRTIQCKTNGRAPRGGDISILYFCILDQQIFARDNRTAVVHVFQA